MRQTSEDYQFRTGILLFLLVVGALIIFVRLVFLQVVKGKEYRSLADGNRIKREIIHAPRGIIYDRNGYPLVRNIPGFRIKEGGKIKVLSREEALTLQMRDEEALEIDLLREYLFPLEFAHVLGYLGEGNAAEVVVGKMGVEEQYNRLLSGTDGKKLIEVDADLSKKRLLGEIKAKPGDDLKITLDLALQKRAFEAMENVAKGALIATDPRNGEILALISKPSFSPNLFTLGGVGGDVEEVLHDENKPLFNRAISGTYPPGSTFKIITAAAGIEDGKITKESKIEDVGIIRVGQFSFPNWYFIQYGKLEGLLDVVGALRRSNDIFFYKVAEMVGIETLGKMAKKFGVGRTLGIDLVGEAAGLFPDEEWKIAHVQDKWYLGDTYHVGIGQGYLLTTPLQINALTGVIANNGISCQPTVLKRAKCNPSVSLRAKGQNAKFLNDETISLIKEGMRQACSPGGTGWPLFKFKIKSASERIKIDERNFFLPEEATVSGKSDGWIHIPVACKTGTAEFGDPKNRTHAWFTVFAPVEDPEIVITVLVEGEGEGSNVAAPIAKQVLEEWFSR